MSRFFKSAAFPILIVIVLAFFASKLIARSDQAPAKSFAGFLEQVDKGQVQTVTLRTKDNSAEITLKGLRRIAEPLLKPMVKQTGAEAVAGLKRTLDRPS